MESSGCLLKTTARKTLFLPPSEGQRRRLTPSPSARVSGFLVMLPGLSEGGSLFY